MRRFLPTMAGCAVLIYALVAGLRTNDQPDLWWQLASGRWMWIHHAILRQETFSYTAGGVPWNYPVAGEILFYVLYRLGGFALLLSLAPLACLTVTFLLLGRSGLIPQNGATRLTRAWAVALAVPMIARRTEVRAELFTMVLMTTFLIILWNDHWHRQEKIDEHPQGHRDWLWLLPPLMVVWVNLHPGFILGLGLMGLFAIRHPRRLIPWTLAATAATLLNPFGWRIYGWIGSLLGMLPLPDAARSLFGQTAPSATSNFINEFLPVPVSWPVIGDALRWTDTNWSSFWFLMFLALTGTAAGLYYRRPWGSLILAVAVPCGLERLRFRGEFAVCAAIVAPALLTLGGRGSKFALGRVTREKMRTLSAALLIGFCTACSAELVTNRYSFQHESSASFGLGFSRPPADRAIQFIRDNHLPREIFNAYGAGGYLTWAAAPGSEERDAGAEGRDYGYPVFIDGRGDPYGPSLIFLAKQLSGQPPSSQQWRWAMRRWNIHTVVALVTRSGGMQGISATSFCDSTAFRLAFLDENMAVFTRPEDLRTPPLDCQTVQIASPAATASRWDRYNTYSIAGRIYYTLGRYEEAERAWRQAAAIFGEGAETHVNLGLLRQHQGHLGEAERELRMAVRDFPSAGTYGMLGNLLTLEGRASEAAECLRASAARDTQPYVQWSMIGRNELAADRPQEALDAIGRAERLSPFQGDAAFMGLSFMVDLLALKGKVLLALKRPQEAVQAFETSWQMSPGVGQPADFQVKLAEAYRAAGRPADAERVLSRR